MAQTKRKRRRKHRGTQGGRIDARPKGRPRNRAEAKQRAASRRSGSGKRGAAQPRVQSPPSWRSAAMKAVPIAGVFFALLVLVLGESVGPAAALAGFMLLFYVPMAYYSDSFFYNRRLRKEAAERAVKTEGSG